MSLHLSPPFRADHIGSLKRPVKLLEKRKAFDSKQCTQEELTTVEDEAIKVIVQIQREAGIKSITDGEFRRCVFCTYSTLICLRILGNERHMFFDGVFNNLEEGDRFAREAEEGRRLGFDGKSLIHTNQIALCHRAFAPSATEVERAKALVEAFNGGAERFGAEMIERMHVDAARRVLERSRT